MADTTLDITTLGALCDVFVPSVRPPSSVPLAMDQFFVTTATDAGTHHRVAALLTDLLDPSELADLATLLRVLKVSGIRRLPWQASQRLLATLGRADADARKALRDLRELTMVAHYGASWDTDDNPTWRASGYPGPPLVARRDDEPLPLLTPTVTDGTIELTADAVVVGSGAGGGVVAARLAAAGLAVVVLEAGGPAQEQDFPDDELAALRQLYWRGGLVKTEEGNVTVLAGGTLGGGTTVNWSNCVAPPRHVLQTWTDEHGVDGLLDGEFEASVAAVRERIGASDEATELNGPNSRLLEGAKALGWSAHRTARNVDATVEDAAATGHTGMGDRTGAKLGSLRTWLRDAVADGARVLTRCTVERVLTEDGAAHGVIGTTLVDGRAVPTTVRARTVVLAAGALETPAILLRSGIGGPATGRHLRLHPVPIVSGVYDEPQDAWSGPPQGVVVDERAAVHDGHGYLVETGAWHPGLSAGAIGWSDARAHRLVMSRFDRLVGFLAVTRERGSGSITLDERGEAVVHYPLDDPFDHDVLRAALTDLVRLHEAAGARLVIDLATDGGMWRRGEPLEPFLDALLEVPLGAAGRGLFSAHQMGSARLGADPRTSVADPDGQLHDTPGVWIGDASAFPTAVGSNPMLTVMSLAHRTAGRILARA